MTEDINARLALHAETRRHGASDQNPLHQNAKSDPMSRGVTKAWLAQAFRLDTATVTKRLRDCPVKTVRARGTKMTEMYYDLPTAASFLVTPYFSTKDYMRSLKKGDMPASLQQAAWDALLKRQKWEEQAGQLWRTAQVREVLGGTFQTIKFTVQLWSSQIEDQTELTDEQRQLILTLSDGLMSEIYDAMVRQMQDQQTPSQLAELPKHTGGETRPIAEIIAEVETDDDDWDSQIEELI